MGSGRWSMSLLALSGEEVSAQPYPPATPGDDAVHKLCMELIKLRLNGKLTQEELEAKLAEITQKYS